MTISHRPGVTDAGHEAGGSRAFTLPVEDGVPYRRDEQPTSYVYCVSIETTSGFVPFLEAPGSSDSRFLGARVSSGAAVCGRRDHDLVTAGRDVRNADPEFPDF